MKKFKHKSNKSLALGISPVTVPPKAPSLGQYANDDAQVFWSLVKQLTGLGS
jgi:hypothetical protein